MKENNNKHNWNSEQILISAISKNHLVCLKGIKILMGKSWVYEI